MNKCMMLAKIIADAKKEVAERKKTLPLAELKKKTAASPLSRNFYKALNKNSGIALIAEIKRASPSSGVINSKIDIAKQIQMYTAGGASAISVVTNKKYFNGYDNFIAEVKKVTTLPVLRKDFIIDPYQIYESKFLGADAILLIARLFTQNKLSEFINLSQKIGLDCLVETHSEEDIEKTLATGAKIIGINSRDLDTLKIDAKRAQTLARLIPPSRLLVAESGIKNRADVEAWKKVGARAILVGTTLMQAGDVKKKIRELIE